MALLIYDLQVGICSQLSVVIADACGAGNEAAGRRSLEALTFAGDAIITDTAACCRAVGGGP